MFFADGERISILLHVSSTRERQEYRAHLSRIISLNYTSANNSSYY